MFHHHLADMISTLTPNEEKTMITEQIKIRYSIKQKMTLLLSSVFVSLIVITNVIHYFHATTDLKVRIKTNLEETASSLASLIDGDKHSELKGPSDQQKPDYQDYFALLAKQRQHFKKITYVYTMRIDHNGKVVYVIDADTEAESNQGIGTVYDDADENFTELVKGLKEPKSDDEFATDKWGTWLSGYAPIFTSDGKLDGILGVDMNADDVRAYKNQILYSSIAITIFASFIAIILSIFLSKYFTTPIKELIQQMIKVTDGDFGATISLPPTNDELTAMVDSFNQMSATLGETFSDLEAELQKSRALSEKMRQGEEKLLQSFYFLRQPVLFIEDNILIDCNEACINFFGVNEKIDLVNNEFDLLSDEPSTRQIIDRAIENPKQQHLLSFKTASGSSITHLISASQLYIREAYIQVIIIHPNVPKVALYE